MWSGFRIAEGASREDLLEYVNRCNSDYVMFRAALWEDGVYFDYYMILSGSISKRSLVHSIRRFYEVLGDVIKSDTENVLC